jgi:hypothetical protein
MYQINDAPWAEKLYTGFVLRPSKIWKEAAGDCPQLHHGRKGGREGDLLLRTARSDSMDRPLRRNTGL